MTFISTYTGKRFYYNYMSPEQVDLIDIAHALSRNFRFNGHSEKPLSVAQHLINGYKVLEYLGFSDHILKEWFIHDFTEAYVADVPKPLKDLLPEYNTMEAKVEKVIRKRFDMPEETETQIEDIVKGLDMTMYQVEAKYFMKDSSYINLSDTDYRIYLEIVDFSERSVDEVKKEFLKIAKELGFN